MRPFLDLLVANPLALLFVIAAIGYPLGQLRIGGMNVGVAAVLFVGIFFGALDARLKLPELIMTLGLVLFVYTMGLMSGPGFFATLRRRGLQAFLVALTYLVIGSLVVVAVASTRGLPWSMTAGMFAGLFTTTPGLASVLEWLRSHGHEALLNDPTVGYSLAYPVSVAGLLAALSLHWRIHRAWEPTPDPKARRIEVVTVLISNPAVFGKTLAEITQDMGTGIIFTRVRKGDLTELANSETVIEEDMEITLVGRSALVDAAVPKLGEVAPNPLELDRTDFNMRRIFVSNSAVAGRPLSELAMPTRFGAIITRLGRGDHDILPTGDTVLEFGDRVRVLAPRERLPEVAKFLGDSYRSLSEIDVLSFALGILVGLLVGMIPIRLPGAFTVSLGVAGGPLLVALILGSLHRTGPLVWNLPYSANLTLRQFGLLMFFAGVGVRSGNAFWQAIQKPATWPLVGAGFLLIFLLSFTFLLLATRLKKASPSEAMGLVCALQTQPAGLAFSVEVTGSEKPNQSYASIFPIASILKIVVAQLIVMQLLQK